MVAEPAEVTQVEDPHRTLRALRDRISEILRGKPEVIRLTLVGLLSGGHLLLEDVPGVGKTTLALALARTLGMSFRRIQFTSDLLPSDILGVSVYSQETGEFTFKPGPIFAGLVLADEINRSTPRTQSALLEAMSDGSVSIDNVTRPLSDPFHVIATQNPLEHHGTYPLPESQLDRFTMRLSIGYPDPEIERSLILDRRADEPVDSVEAIVEPEQFLALQRRVDSVDLEESVADYLLEIVLATRRDDRVRIGVSPRGALALTRTARALALLEGRSFCIPDDIRELAVPCLAHRLSLTSRSSGPSRRAQEMITDEIVSRIEIPV
jgi:MoxR-like ATPase